MKISKIVKPALIAASVGGAFVFGFSAGAVSGAGLMYFGIEDIQKKAKEKDAESVEKLYADTMDDMIKTNQKTQWADWARESDQMDRRITGLMAIGHSAVEIAEMMDITLSEVRTRSSAEFNRKMTKLSDQVFAMYRGGQSVKTISASLDMSESTVLTRLKGSITDAITDATTAGAPQEEIAKLVAMSVEILQPGEVIEMDVASAHPGTAKWEEIAGVFKQMYNVELSEDQKLMKSSTYGKDQSKAMDDVEEELKIDPRKIVVRDGGIAGKDDEKTKNISFAAEMLVKYLERKDTIGDEDVTFGLVNYETVSYGWSADLEQVYTSPSWPGPRYRVFHRYDPKCTNIILIETGVTVASTGVDDIPNPEDATSTTES